MRSVSPQIRIVGQGIETFVQSVFVGFGLRPNIIEVARTVTAVGPLLRNTEIIERPADWNTMTERYSEKAVSYIKKNKDKYH